MLILAAVPLFTLPGRLQLRWLPERPSSLSLLPLDELNDGVDLVGTRGGEELAEFPDWAPDVESVPAAGYSSHVVGTLAGPVTFPPINAAWWKDDATSTIYNTLTPGAAGWLAVGRDGLTVGGEAQLLQVEVMTRSRTNGREGANMFRVVFAVQDERLATLTMPPPPSPATPPAVADWVEVSTPVKASPAVWNSVATSVVGRWVVED